MQVPYKPFPTAEPTSRGAPSIGLSVPGAAFGVNVAQAEEGLGKELQHIGDEFARKAVQFQELDNQTWAKDADVKVMTQIGQAQNDFNQQEGNNSTAALAAHQSRIQQIRQDALDSAPNLMARRLLDESVARRVGFSLVDAGGRAGQQAKVAANRASESRQQAATRQFDFSSATGPQDMDTITNEVRDRFGDRGDSADTIANEVQKAKSKALLNGLNKMAPQDPIGAKEKLEIFRDQLDPEDRMAAQNIVNKNMTYHDTRIEADKILKDFDVQSGPGQKAEIIKRAEDTAEKRGKDNPDYHDILMSRVRSGMGLAENAYRDTQLANKYKVESFVHGQDFQNKIVSIDAIVGPGAPEEVRNAFQALNPDAQRSIVAQVAKNNKTEVQYTPERQKRYNELWGMSQPTGSPSEYVNLNLYNEDLPRKQIDSLVRRQQQVKNRAAPDQEINKYLSIAQPVMRAAGIQRGKPDSDEAKQYDEFVGALEQEVNDYKARYTKPPDDKEVRGMARNLLGQVVTSPGYIWDTKEKRFEVKIPEQDSKQLEDAYLRVKGTKPTPEIIRQLYLQAKKFPEVK